MNTESRIFDADCLREILGYSIRFDKRIVCAVIDAESFEDYDYTQMVQDFLLLRNSCDVKIIVVIGCFPTRSRKKKRENNLQKISYVLEEISKNFVGAGKQILVIEESGQPLVKPLSATLEEQSIVIVTSKNACQADSSDIWNTISSVSKSLGKEKIANLVISSGHDGIFGSHREFLAQIRSEEVKELIKKNTITGEVVVIAETAIRAIEELGIKRIHLVNGTKPDSLLVELLTKDGSGTMIYSGEYIHLRQATTNDVGGMHALMSYYSEHDTSLHCQPEKIEEFIVAAIDDYIVARARLQFFPETKISLLTSLAVNPVYIEIGRKLLEKAVDIGRSQGSSLLYLVTSGVVPWWMPSDFEEPKGLQLPGELQEKYIGKKTLALLVKEIS